MAQRISPSVFDKVDTFLLAFLFCILIKIKYVRKLLACIFYEGIHRVPFIYLLNFFLLMMNSKIQKAEDGKNAGSAKKCVQTGKKVADKKEANKKQAAQVAVFENPEFGMVRTTIDKKGEPWFCAKNLCDVLEYRKMNLLVNQYVNPLDALKRCIKDMVCMNCWAG